MCPGLILIRIGINSPKDYRVETLESGSYTSAYPGLPVRGYLTCGTFYILDSGRGSTENSSSEGSFRAGPHKELRDFDDGANALWSLFGKEAKTHDEARISSLAADMDGVLLFVRV